MRIFFFLWFPTWKSELISFNFNKNSLKVTKLFFLMPVYSRYWKPILKFQSLRRLNSSSHALLNETRWYSNGNERVKSFNTNLPEEVRMLNCEKPTFSGCRKENLKKRRKSWTMREKGVLRKKELKVIWKNNFVTKFWWIIGFMLMISGRKMRGISWRIICSL